MELVHHEAQGPRRRTPVLFVHGAWHSAWCWRRHFLPYFAARGWPAYALSLRGHGGTPARGSLRRTTLGDYADDVAEAVRRIGAAPVLVGHSMGGLIVQRYLQRHDDAPAAVLLASVPPANARVPGAWGATLRVAGRHPLAFARAVATLRLWPVVDDPERARRLLVSDRLTPAEWAEVQPTLQDESFTAYLGMLFRAPVARPLRTPLLVVGAENDRIVSTADVRRTARAYGAGCRLLPRLGHDVMLDPEWPLAAGAIVSWLEERGL
jgi:pimeloyl-ACP methyl ester carboxylesterase